MNKNNIPRNPGVPTLEDFKLENCPEAEATIFIAAQHFYNLTNVYNLRAFAEGRDAQLVCMIIQAMLENSKLAEILMFVVDRYRKEK